MPRGKKTWRQKLAAAKAKPGLPKKWYCQKTRQHMVVPSPDEVERIVRRVRRGKLITMAQIGDLLRQKHAVDLACSMTTGIFAWLIAHAADEAARDGRKVVPPWWRVLKAGGELNPKYPGQGATQRARLREEGHRVVRKGKKLVVADYERALVGRVEPGIARFAASRPGKTGKAIRRKVLRRDDFGLCVLLPKTAWGLLPQRGSAAVRVHGTRRRVTVRSERCNCRGTDGHEHRFLSLGRSPGVAENDVVTIEPAGQVSQ